MYADHHVGSRSQQESPLLPHTSVVSDVEYSKKEDGTDACCPINGTAAPLDDQRPRKRPRAASQPSLAGAAPVPMTPPNLIFPLYDYAQQQADFLRQENDALREQQRDGQHVTNRVVMENQLLRDILWSYVQLKKLRGM